MSVLHQGLPGDAYEVILVDDGSTDGSSTICDTLSSHYHQIRTIHQENKGVAAARNNGMETAAGIWIAFIDADDYLLDDGYKIAFLPYANRSDVDIIHYFSDYDFWSIRKLEKGVQYEGRAYELMLEEKEFLPSFCWLFFYKRKFIEQNKLRFRPYKVGEDQLFATSAYLTNPYILTVKADIYRYAVHGGSATTRRSVAYARRCVHDYIASYVDILDFAHKCGIGNNRNGGG